MGTEELAHELMRAFTENDQDAFRASPADDVVYREFATRSEARGVDEVMEAVDGTGSPWRRSGVESRPARSRCPMARSTRQVVRPSRTRRAW